MISAKIVCDSIGAHSPRLTTFLTKYPRFIHDEHLRHRAFSFSVSSSRAIPVAKKLEEVRSDELRAAPVFWGAEQKGMSPGGELSDELDDDPIVGPSGEYWSLRRWVQYQWARSAHSAADHAEILIKAGVHKSIINRLLDPFCHCNVLCTATEAGLLNWFGLRLDQAAEPTIRALAESMWRAWNESTPQKLKPGQWHLPFVDPDEEEIMRFVENMGRSGDLPDDAEERLRIRVSVARCARLSYMSFDTGKRSTIEEDLGLYDRLVGSHPIHASPAEHQATPDRWMTGHAVPVSMDENGSFMFEGKPGFWAHPELSGNLGPGWIQYRKTLPGEAVAPLPEGYAR